MSQYHFPGHGKVVKELQEQMEREAEERNKEIKSTSLMLLNAQDGVYGSHQSLPTVYREKWLAKLREERDNPMLGKSYISRAPEYETDADVVTEAHELTDQETKDMFVTDENGNKYIPETYNPNVDDSQTSDMDDSAKKVIDMCIIQQVANKCIGWEFEDVMKECAMAFEEEYGEDFTLPDNMDEIVTAAIDEAETNARISYEKSKAEQTEESSNMRPLRQLFGLAKMDPLLEDVKIYVPTPEEFNRMAKERDARWAAFYAKYAPRQ